MAVQSQAKHTQVAKADILRYNQIYKMHIVLNTDYFHIIKVLWQVIFHSFSSNLFFENGFELFLDHICLDTVSLKQ